MTQRTPKPTPRNKMDVAQVSKLMLDIVTTEDPKQKKKLFEFNQPSKKVATKKTKKAK